MIKKFIDAEIDAFFKEKTSCHDLGYFKFCRRWQKDFKCFAEDLFRKWRASRSASSVNKLLDDGMSASQEQCVVQALEEDSTKYFDITVASFEKAIWRPIKWLCITLILLTVLFGIMLKQTTNVLWSVTWINLWIAVFCLLWARILFLISPKVLFKKSYNFIKSFFDDAEMRWAKLQEQYMDSDKE